jgi:2-oxoisovalerate dehydrogenase E1 component
MLQQEGLGFYTIGSAGHEGNAMIAMALRTNDPALLHYRSGGFYVARAQQVTGSTPVRDVLQGLMGLADEPIAGGRHKVFGHPDLAIIPQTSTIASHLPRAVGLAIALHRAHRLKVEFEWPRTP